VPSFQTPQLFMDSVTSELSASLVAETHDISLIIDSDGIIRDVAVSEDDPSLQVALDWIGSPWLETVTIESQPKIRALLEPSKKDNKPRWRQVNHAVDNGVDLPISYKTMRNDDAGLIIAVGRNLRLVSELQQRLLDTQQSLERDYARLHQAEVRYRMLFSMASEAILFVDADSRKIVEANPAAGKALQIKPSKLLNRTFPRGFSDNSNDTIEDLLLRVRAAGRGEAVIVRSASGENTFRLTASLLRRDEGPYFLVRLSNPDENSRDSTSLQVLEVVNRSPDGFVVTDADGRVIGSNQAFLEMCEIATDLQAIKQPLDSWLGRPGVDVSLLMRNLRDRGEVRQFVTTLTPEYSEPYDIELSAVSALDSDDPCCGFVIRRHLSSAPREMNNDDQLPRSLSEMTDLVGRVPLKDLVRETTDIIERMCIEAALKMTDDSRASAAEMLGLSRQSLYVKLHRYGIAERDDSK
jgi:transcriptional regulator PpsR